jgi:hypothetical protein
MGNIVLIRTSNPMPPGLTEAGINGVGYPPAVNKERADSAILSCVVPDGVRRSIGGIIIHNNKLKVFKGLSYDGFYCLRKKDATVIDGHNHR